MANAIHIRAIDPNSQAELEIVAQGMRATLIEVEGEATGTALYTTEWLRDRVRWHLDADAVAGGVFLAVGSNGEIAGHTIVRREPDPEGGDFGLFATTFVAPEARRSGIASELLRAGEDWFRSQSLPRCATWTSSTNFKLIRLYETHGYAQNATHTHETTDTLMVRLERSLACVAGDQGPAMPIRAKGET